MPAQIPAVPTTGVWYRHVPADAPPMPGHPAPDGRWQRGEQLAGAVSRPGPRHGVGGVVSRARRARRAARPPAPTRPVAVLAEPASGRRPVPVARRWERSACRTPSQIVRSGRRSRTSVRDSRPTVSRAFCSAPAPVPPACACACSGPATASPACGPRATPSGSAPRPCRRAGCAPSAPTAHNDQHQLTRAPARSAGARHI